MPSSREQDVASGTNASIRATCAKIVREAKALGASDVHVEPWSGRQTHARARVGGDLVALESFPQVIDLGSILRVFKVAANIPIDEKGIPRDGYISASDTVACGVDLRLSFFPLLLGEKMVIRLFGAKEFELSKLLEPNQEVCDQLVQMIHRTSGLLLFAGPTGSGKTTVMYSAIGNILAKRKADGKEFSVNVSSVEDPVESPLEGVSQAQINISRGFTYESALRSLMRQNPDVIMIGEIRDPETAHIATRAGLTGHLVLSTIHSPSTVEVFGRLGNMKLNLHEVASCLIGVIGLRLIRLNCEGCKCEDRPKASLLRAFELPPTGVTYRKGKGAACCLGQGYKERRLLSELLKVDEVRDIIRDGMSLDALRIKPSCGNRKVQD